MLIGGCGRLVANVVTGYLGRWGLGRVRGSSLRVMMGTGRNCFEVYRRFVVLSAIGALLLRSRRVLQLFDSRSANGSEYWRRSE